jgi:hypothetical protein
LDKLAVRTYTRRATLERLIRDFNVLLKSLGKDTIYPGLRSPKKILTEPFRFYYFDLDLNTPDAAALNFFPFCLIPPGIRQRVSLIFLGDYLMAERITLLTLYCSAVRISVINSLKIVKTLPPEIPPNLPLLKGGIIPLFGKEGRGEIFWVMSIQ